MNIRRREFLEKSSKITLGIGAGLAAQAIKAQSHPNEEKRRMNTRDYLKEILYTRKEVDDWFAGRAFPFSRYHSDFGWLLPNSRFKDGIDDSISTYTYAPDDGERRMGNYGDKPCRINTYGDSFTQCHQVSDHETWQEVLAAHLQEPIRNYGIGGWSVYQAYLRMLGEESRNPAQYIIFNIYEDDHKRNLDSWRNIRVRQHPQHIEATLPYLKVDLTKKKVTEHKNPCPTPESCYDLCDIDKVYDMFKDDFVLKVMVAHRNSDAMNINRDYSELTDLIKTHGITTKIDESRTVEEEAERIHTEAALFSSKKLIDKIDDFARENNKKVLFVLSYPGKAIARYIKEGYRFDEDLINYLDKKDLVYMDLLAEHARDFSQHNLELRDYIDKYLIGHYNPRGNFFCAFALKDKLVGLLNPKPLPYAG